MSTGPRVKWDRVKGDMKMMRTRMEAQEEKPIAGMSERSQSRSAVGADLWTVGALPRIELPGGVPPTYPRGPGPWDV